MINIEIDVTENLNIEDWGNAQIQAFDASIEALALSARDKWIEIAQDRLKSARGDYIRGLQEDLSFQANGEMDYQINLVGWLPNAVEGGMAPYDMKPILLNGPAAAKNGGRYMTVPFRHYKDSQSAERMNKAPNYKQDLQKVLKQSGLGKIKKNLQGKPLSGKVGVARGTDSYIKKLKPHHKNSIFEGLTQTQKTYGNSTQSQLTTFRRVSRNSAPESWLHPGINAANLRFELTDWINEQVETMLKEITKGG